MTFLTFAVDPASHDYCLKPSREEPLELKGYHDDGMLKFYNRLSDGDKSVRVDCDKAIPVFVEVNPHDPWSIVEFFLALQGCARMS